MDQNLLKRLISFRRELHQFPETSLKEFETQKRIRRILIDEFGVPEDAFTELKPTALVVELRGKAAPQGKDICVAFRADMDALSMTEQNPHLEYQSQNKGAAHMCGHDGHVTCLLGFVPLFLKEIDSIPKNKSIKLFFQPSEQGPTSGAKIMIDQGCLEGVDEVYGCHNWPVGNFGDLWCKEGPVMSKSTVLKIKIIGTGGHGSEPEKLKVAIWRAVDFYQKITKFLSDLLISSGKFFVCTLPVFHSGERFNVISESASMEGTLRTFDEDIYQIVIAKFKQLLEEVKNDGFTYEFDYASYTITSNTKKEAENVLRVARGFLGQDKVGTGELPFRASEDFGEYTLVKPGAFFFFCTKKQQNEVFLHNSHFDFKDQLIEIASTFWLKLALDRMRSE